MPQLILQLTLEEKLWLAKANRLFFSHSFYPVGFIPKAVLCVLNLWTKMLTEKFKLNVSCAKSIRLYNLRESACWGGSEGRVPPVLAYCGHKESLPVALLVVNTNSSGHDREEMGSSEWFGGVGVTEGVQHLNWLMGARTWNNAGGTSGGFAAQNYKQGSRPAEAITA